MDSTKPENPKTQQYRAGYRAGYQAGWMAGKRNLTLPRDYNGKIIDYAKNLQWRLKYAPESLPESLKPKGTNQASEVKRNSLNKSDEDVKLELDEIFNDDYFDVKVAKQAILDWHNKQIDSYKGIIKMADKYTFDTGEVYYSQKAVNRQIEEVLDRLLKHGEDFTTFGDGGRSVAVEYIEAERNKLKEPKV